MFQSLPLPLNLAIFAGLAVVIWQAGTRLSYLIDAVAENTKLARAFLGLVFLASATGLPEVATTVSAALNANAVLALNNMFGGIAMQTAVLAAVDWAICRRPLTSYPTDPLPVIQALMLILGLAAVLVIGMFGDFTVAGHLGGAAIAAAVYYGICLHWLRKWQSRDMWSPLDLPDEAANGETGRENRFDRLSLRQLSLQSVLASLLILVCGFLLVRNSETLAQQTGLGQSFIGVSLLAATTSLPEVSTSTAAIRVKAHDMAISNIIGSNLIMLFLILPADLAYLEGTILDHLDTAAQLAVVAGIAVTAVLATGMLVRSRARVLGMGVDSLIILVLYIAALFGLYVVR